MLCLHKRPWESAYDEQRERETRSVSSLLIRAIEQNEEAVHPKRKKMEEKKNGR